MEREKIIVEFEVEKTVDSGYGIQQKYLLYNGEPTKYKAIVKDGNLIAIVSRGYALLPNRKILLDMKEAAALPEETVERNWNKVRMLLRIPIGKGFELLIVNSEDSSMTLSIHLLYDGLIVKGTILPRHAKVTVFRRKHYGKLSIGKIKEVVDYLTNIADELSIYLPKILNTPIAPEHIPVLNSCKIPEKYKKQAPVGGTVGQWFGAVSQAVWRAALKENVRYHYLKEIAETLSVIALGVVGD